MDTIGDGLWAVILIVALLLSTPLVDRLFRSDRPVGGRRGWNHFDGNPHEGWTVRHSVKWHGSDGEWVSLTPEGAKALGLWDERK